jgi:hypothetical protein
LKIKKNLERRNYGGIDTMGNTTTATQRRDRRKELEEKYGLRSTTNNAKPREQDLTDVIAG